MINKSPKITKQNGNNKNCMCLYLKAPAHYTIMGQPSILISDEELVRDYLSPSSLLRRFLPHLPKHKNIKGIL